MSDKEARAVGASASVQVGEEIYEVSPIGFRQLQEIQREAVRYYKRQYLQTFADNMDLLGNGDGHKLLREKLDEVAKWGIGDLPTRWAHDASQVEVTSKLKSRLVEEFGEIPDTDKGVRALLATALDTEQITVEEVAKLTKTNPRRGQVPYDTWWVTAVYEGMVSLVWSSLHAKHPELTKEDISNWSLAKIAGVAREAERVTTPDLGNM